jgi:hypothetical protein
MSNFAPEGSRRYMLVNTHRALSVWVAGWADSTHALQRR